MPGITAMIVLAAATAALQPQPPADPAPDSEIVQAEVDRETRLTVPVLVQGQGPFRFLVDTGSERTVISDGLADRLELPQGPRALIIGVAGSVEVGTVHVSAMTLGSRRLDDMIMPVLERRDMGADGILGTDGLQDQRVLLDFRNSRMEIGDARTLGGDGGFEIVVRARRRSGQLIMTNARIDGVAVSVVIDTGAGITVGNRALQRALGKRGSASMPIQLQSVTGQTVTADIGFASKLDVGSVSITKVMIAFADSPAFPRLELDRRPALFLGMREMRLFRRLAIDFAKRSVLFDLPPGT